MASLNFTPWMISASNLTSDLHKRLLIKPSHLDTRLLWLK
ncbi:hypothetical protein BTN49_0071 [Candidatus Enterovibrio escicola]|uniref:Uncharacterized protein n=1 Tax=Candidatus Enterovibrio escicola TaxID=1927127 RepID=A0A2A5T7T9_9GAMM|nr:hypothetical protein BTN49_0071 [Candidatus Enterovibrio escacola]